MHWSTILALAILTVDSSLCVGEDKGPPLTEPGEKAAVIRPANPSHHTLPPDGQGACAADSFDRYSDDLCPDSPGDPILDADEFRRSLAQLSCESQRAMTRGQRKCFDAPYAAFSLNAAERQIRQAGGDFRPTHSDVFYLGGINRVRGLVCDRDGGDLILVGAIEPGRAPLTLDDLVVALRAAIVHSEWPAVEISDLPAKEPEEPRASRLFVEYKAGIDDTQFGADLLDAYCHLRLLAEGLFLQRIDGVVSYRDLVARQHEHRYLEGHRLTTFPLRRPMFVPSPDIAAEIKISLSDPWKRPRIPAFRFAPGYSDLTVRDHVILIHRTKVIALHGSLAEFLRRPQWRQRFASLPEDEFANQVTERFERLCSRYFSFNRLRGLMEMVVATGAMKRLNRRPDLSFWLNHYRVQKVETPATVDFLSRIFSRLLARPKLDAGNETQSHLFWPPLKRLPECESRKSDIWAMRIEHGDAIALRDAILETKPAAKALCWALDLEPHSKRAKPTQEHSAEDVKNLRPATRVAFPLKAAREDVRRSLQILERREE